MAILSGRSYRVTAGGVVLFDTTGYPEGVPTAAFRSRNLAHWTFSTLPNEGVTMDELKITREDLLSETYPGEAMSKALHRFAVEVAAAEIEACARVAEGWSDRDAFATSIAAAIRARGQP